MPTQANQLTLGTPAPTFALTDVVTDDTVTLERLLHRTPQTRGTLLLFVCVHCPYVKHVEAAITQLSQRFGEEVAFAAISSNDPAQYPEDAPAGMREQAARNGWDFPYLFDDSQEVARGFDAVCTPECFLLDASGALVYHGRLDATRPARSPDAPIVPATGEELAAALEALCAGRPPLSEQFPSVGCSIKWK